ncbi:MAG: hypothetical protein ILO68_00420, partial [Clostridia bacterium]|nr:hypothetical protein [Clostridia bacterium]
MKAAFGKLSTKGVFSPVWPYGTDLYERLIYLEQNGVRVLICVFDFNGTFPSDTDRFRKEVSSATGIPEGNIWYHELQIHASPTDRDIHGAGIDELIKRTVREAERLKEAAEDVEVTVAEADFGTDCSFNREQYVEGLGGVTVWSGMSYDNEGRPYTQDPDIMLLRGYRPDLPVFEKPIYFDNPNDPKAYLFVFRSRATGKVIGSVSRFAAHPDVAVLFELKKEIPAEIRHKEYHYDYDWPGYLSDGLEEELGGVSVYLNGPCADLSAKKRWEGMDTYEASAADCRRLAGMFKNRLLETYRTEARDVRFDRPLKAETFEIELPVKEDFPRCRKDLDDWEDRVAMARKAKEDAIEAGKAPAEIKRLIDDEWRTTYFRHMVYSTGNFTDEELSSRRIRVHPAAIRFGDYLFVGVPGESLVDTTLWLRSQFTGVKTIPIDQVNGYYNYLATPRSMTLGGYTYWCSWVARNA